MRRKIAVTACVLLIAVAARAACPEKAPPAFSMEITSSCGETVRACETEIPMSLRVRSISPGGYEMQACDIAIWDFGDGTLPMVARRPDVLHEYAKPGNYRVTVTVANALGNAVARAHRVAIADAPAPTLSIPTTTTRKLAEGTYYHDIFVQRAGDTSRMVSVKFDIFSVVALQRSGTRQIPVGATQAPLRIELFDDNLSGGSWNDVTIRLSEPEGGAVLRTQFFTIEVTDDEPVAVISVDNVEVSEGDGVARIPVRTSWPMAHDLSLGYSVLNGTATDAADFVLPSPLRYANTTFPPAQPAHYIEVPIVDDDVAEGTETFEVVVYETFPSSPFVHFKSVITIRDDDGGGRRRSVRK